MKEHKNRYTECLSTLRNRGERAFIPFAVAGDPDPETSLNILKTYIESGADILEIGLPFSDPIADGPTNVHAAQRALKNGITLKGCFKIIKELRKMTDIPFGLLLYANTAYKYGYDRFFKRCSESGVDSILIPDLPPEESRDMIHYAAEYNIKTVFIVSELTPDSRIRLISSKTTGFIYLVSRLGTTGERKEISTTVKESVRRIKRFTDTPVLVGFGISTPEHVRAVTEAGADGAIVGSALVKSIERHLNSKSRLFKTISNQVKDFKKATMVGK
ncbi:MAG: tryptophan synthase subunit alpha [Chitinivibrionales bacterium]